MSQLPNPNQAQPFEIEYTNEQGDKIYGERTVDGLKEIVDLKTGKSNMTYIKPEPVTFYDGCTHEFRMLNVGTREIECEKCQFQLTFHVTENYFEEDGKAFVLLNKRKYPIN